MRVYHFVNLEYGLEDLRRRRLKVATIHQLNDPFELLGFASADRSVRQAFERTKDRLASTTGMLCFSRNWQNPVQWSHYADRHRGVCFGFDVPEDNLVAVSYRSKRHEPELEALRGDDILAERYMLQMLCTKFSHWRYENEVRCFVSLKEQDEESGLYFTPFSDGLELREVIVGHCSTVQWDDLEKALGELASGVAIFKARLAFRSFKIVRQRDPELWP